MPPTGSNSAIERGAGKAKLRGDRIGAQIGRSEVPIDIATDSHERRERRRSADIALLSERRRGRFRRERHQTFGDRVEIGQPHFRRCFRERPQRRADNRSRWRLALQDQAVQRVLVRDKRQNPVARRPERHAVDKPFRRRFAHRERLRQVNKDYVAGLGSNGTVAREPGRRAIDLQANRKPFVGGARGSPNERQWGVPACAQHVVRRGVDIDLTAKPRDLRRRRADFEHLAERVAPLNEQFRWGAIFRL